MATKVIQWATGGVGRFSLQQIIDDPDLELVGCWVSGSKAGTDAGDLCDRPATGVIATSDKDALVELDADLVIHCPAPIGDFDGDVARLLASGKNVISTLGYFSPRTDGEDVIARMQQAGVEGGATLYGAGLDPGFVCDRVAAVMTGSLMEVHRIRMAETVDFSTYPNADVMMDLGIGKPIDQLSFDTPHIQHFVLRLFPGAVAKLADQLGLDIDEVRLTGMPELLTATQDLDLAIGHIAKGTLSGALYEYGGYRDGECIISHQWVHYAERDAAPEHWLKAPPQEPGKAMPYAARVEIDGRPNLVTDMVYTDDEDTIFLPTAACVHRAIPEVLAAAPGWLAEPVFGAWRPSRTPV